MVVRAAACVHCQSMTGHLILPRGITGFDIVSAPFDPTLLRQFGAVCHVVARAARWTVRTVRSCEGEVTPNFHLAELHRSVDSVYLLCNAHFPWIAATLRRPEWMGTSFVDLPELTRSASALPGFVLPAAQDLNRLPEPSELEELAEGERRQYRYWSKGNGNVARLGDVIFNFWD